jgi:hypothetical protein
MRIKLVSKQLDCRGSGLVRSPLPHVTQIIRSIGEQLQLVRTYNEPAPGILAEPGFIWEDVLSLAWATRHAVRPEEVVRGLIACSPDGILNGRLQEYKFTWASSKKPPEDNWAWMAQIKAYCYVLGFQECDLYVLYINGDYSFRPFRPHYRHYEIAFTEEELKSNWDMIANHFADNPEVGFE